MAATTSGLQDVMERLEGLERQSRMVKRVGVSVFIGAATLALMAQARPSRTIEAQQFVVKDSSNRARLILSGDRPRVELCNEHRLSVPTLDATPDGGGLSLNDPNGAEAVALRISRYGRSLTLHDANRQRRVELNLEREGGVLSFYRATGELVATLDGRGEKGLSLYDGNGKLRIALALWTRTRPSSLYRGCGKRDAGPDGLGGRSTLTFYDPEGNCEYSVP